MLLEPILIDGVWEQGSDTDGSFQSMNPSTKQPMPYEYPVSGMQDLERMFEAAERAVVELRSVSPDQIADFLEAYADGIEAHKEALVDMAQAETALGKEPRLGTIEIPRTTNQLRQGATAARDRSWCMATIDSGTNIRSKFGAIGGPVAVFGPNNFPYAFNSVSGGDFAAAIAAGNPVIAKANTSHPQTTKLLAEIALDAAKATGMPAGMIQMLYRTKRDVGLAFVSHPKLGATGFTGSKSAGLNLKAAADKAGKPIYLEMSAVNPVFMLPGALAERSEALADEFAISCAMGTGQFCTNPGVVVLMENAQSEAFTKAVGALLESKPAGTMLGPGGPSGVAEGIGIWQENGAELVVGGKPADGPGYRFENTLVRVAGDQFIQHPQALQEEAFGVASLLIFAKDIEQMQQIAASMDGQLTGGIYSDTGGADDEMYDQIAPILRTKVGRLLNDKMPTGVAVSAAMNHGGPFPATGHPGFTAVGIPASMVRFGALHCYDNVRAHRLPAELQDQNPTGKMWRSIDQVWSQGDVGA